MKNSNTALFFIQQLENVFASGENGRFNNVDFGRIAIQGVIVARNNDFILVDDGSGAFGNIQVNVCAYLKRIPSIVLQNEKDAVFGIGQVVMVIGPLWDKVDGMKRMKAHQMIPVTTQMDEIYWIHQVIHYWNSVNGQN